MNKESPSVSSCPVSLPWKGRHSHYASPSAKNSSTKLLRDVAGQMLIDPGVFLLNGNCTFAPSVVVTFDRQSGAIIDWKVTI